MTSVMEEHGAPAAKDYSKLSIEDKLASKEWQARQEGYEQLAGEFKKELDENSPKFAKYLPEVKRWVGDSNASAQEKGCEAALVLIEGCSGAIAKRFAADLAGALVAKAITARARTQQLARQVFLELVALEAGDAVVDELLKGLAAKAPKAVAAAVQMMADVVREYGVRVYNAKPLLMAIPKIMGHADNHVRKEGVKLAVELYRYTSADVMKQYTKDLKPVQVADLEKEFSKHSTGAVPPRTVRGAPEPTTGTAAPGATAAQDAEVEEADPLAEMQPVGWLSKLPAEFYSAPDDDTKAGIGSKKWKCRQNALDELAEITGHPKLVPANSSELNTSLRKIVDKDVNVNVCVAALACIRNLARGQGPQYSHTANYMLPSILGKFKEKKPLVVKATQEAADACVASAGLAEALEVLVEGMKDKNPGVRKETVGVVARAIAHTRPATIKSQLKKIGAALVEVMEDGAGEVREAAYEAAGNLLKLVGERTFEAVCEIKDKTKLTKVKEHCDKADVKYAGKTSAAPLSAPQPAPAPKTQAAKRPVAGAPILGEALPVHDPDDRSKRPAVSRPAMPAKTMSDNASAQSATMKSRTQSVPARAAVAAAIKKGAPAGKASGDGEVNVDDEPLLADEAVLAEFGRVVGELQPISVEAGGEPSPETLTSGLAMLESKAWKERLVGMEQVVAALKAAEPEAINSQAVLRAICAKPGFKDSNVQVVQKVCAAVETTAEQAAFMSRRAASVTIPGLTERLGDIKTTMAASAALKVLSEAVGLNFVSQQMAIIASGHKNPKVTAAALSWLTDALNEFGMRVTVKPHVDYLQAGLEHSNQAVRKEAIKVLGVIRVFVGPGLRDVFAEKVKPQTLQLIDAEFEKVASRAAPEPTRQERSGSVGVTSSSDVGDLLDDAPVTDISKSISDELVGKLNNANWKERQAGIEEVLALAAANRRIKADLGGLPDALKGRLNDSNKNLIAQALNAIAALAKGMGPQAERYGRTWLPPTLACLADQKSNIRCAALAVINAFADACGIRAMVGEIGAALATDNPTQRKEILQWFNARIGEAPPSLDLAPIIEPTLLCLEDRSADVRKLAQGTTTYVVQSCGYGAVDGAVDSLRVKPATKTSIRAALTKLKDIAQLKVAPIEEAAQKPAAKTATAGAGPKAGAATAPSAPASSRLPTARAGFGYKPVDKPISASLADKPTTAEPVLINMGSAAKAARAEKNKRIRWEFDSAPTPAQIDLLQTEMQPCVGKAVYVQLFSTDFKAVTAGMDALHALVTVPADARDPAKEELALSAIDVLLKYVGIRLCDNNTTLQLKALELLGALLDMAHKAAYQLSEYEASLIVPLLVQKTAEKDMVSREVRKMLRSLCNTYSSMRIFGALADGTKAKSARTRAVALDEIIGLLQRYGMGVCYPTQSRAIQGIVSCIEDRDKSVRDAALNTMVQVSLLAGEAKMWQLAGDMLDKDRSYLAERLKYSSRDPQSSPAASRMTPSRPKPALPVSQPDFEPEPMAVDEPLSTQVEPTAAATSRPEVPRVFSLDMDGANLPPAPAPFQAMPTLHPTRMPELDNGQTPSVQTSRGLGSNMSARQLSWLLLEVSNVDMNMEEAALNFKRLIQLLRDDPIRWEVTDISECGHCCTLHAARSFRMLQDRDQGQHVGALRLVQHTWRMLKDLYSSKRTGRLMTDKTHAMVVSNLVQAAADLPSLVIPDESKNSIGGSLNDVIQLALSVKGFASSFEAIVGSLVDASASNSHSEQVLLVRCLDRLYGEVKIGRLAVEEIDSRRVVSAMHNFLTKEPRSNESVYVETIRLFAAFAYQMAMKLGGYVYTYPDNLQGNATAIRDILRQACEKVAEKENGHGAQLDWQAEVAEYVRLAKQSNASEGINELVAVRMNYADAALLMEKELQGHPAAERILSLVRTEYQRRREAAEKGRGFRKYDSIQDVMMKLHNYQDPSYTQTTSARPAAEKPTPVVLPAVPLVSLNQTAVLPNVLGVGAGTDTAPPAVKSVPISKDTSDIHALKERLRLLRLERENPSA